MTFYKKNSITSWLFRRIISYIGSSSPFSNGLKKYEIDCSVTSSSRAGFQFGLLSLRTSAALTPAKRPQTLVLL